MAEIHYVPGYEDWIEARRQKAAERAAARKAGALWEAKLDMITDNSVEEAAKVLFPHEISDGTDCRFYVGELGAPCRACAIRFETWQMRLIHTRVALEAAFA